MAKRRDITRDPPRFPIVTPEGLVKLVAVEVNITGALEIVGGQVTVARAYERAGWRLLAELYVEDGRPDLWQAWQAHQAALQAARREGRSLPPFPSQYLPAEVLRRRAGHRPGGTTWTMPDLPPTRVDGAPEPDKRRAKGAP